MALLYVNVLEDDDWWVNNARVLEGAGAMVFEVGFDSPVVRELTIDYETVQVNNGGAKAGLDYIATANSIRFAAGGSVYNDYSDVSR